MIFVSNDESPEVLKPREEAFGLSSLLVATQGTAVLGDGLGPTASVRRYHLDASLSGKRGVERIAVVGFVADQMSGKFVRKRRVQCGLDKGHFMRASTGCVDGERKTASVCKAHDFGSFAPFGLAHTIAPGPVGS
jgi:hypothetical protein